MTDRTLDGLWASLITSKGRCEYCWSKDNLVAHHVVGRRNRGLRWDVRNGVCLCVEHHTMSSTFSAHLTPKKFLEWFKGRRKDDWEYLEREKNKIHRVDKDKIYKELLNKKRIYKNA